MKTPDEMDAEATPEAIKVIGIKPSTMQMHCHALHTAMIEAAEKYLAAQSIPEVARVLCFSITIKAMHDSMDRAMKERG